MKVCTFRIGEMLCAVPADKVREVARVGALTPVPGAPAQVAGILNLRGQVLCAVEAATRLRQSSGGQFSLLISHHGRTVAVLADAIIDISTTTDELHPTPVTVEADARTLIDGVFDTDSGVVHLLDLEGVIGR